MNKNNLLGIDFGTTNSSLAIVHGKDVRLATFPLFDVEADTFRSVLFFETREPGRPTPKPLGGPQAIERYLQPHEGGRLVQSLKSFAGNRSFTSTTIDGRAFTLEELIGLFLRRLRSQAEAQFGELGHAVVAGRPVRFAGDDQDLALERLRAAYSLAGFTEVRFVLEPVGAAYSYTQRLERDQLVLIADFGGGTSDFSLLRFGAQGRTHEVIGSAGVAIGGDTFDARIVRHLVSPLLGLGTTYRSLDKVLRMPSSLYRKLESWHSLSFLRTRENMAMLKGIAAQAEHPERLERFQEIIAEDLGYHLHRAVQKTKVDLSQGHTSIFAFETGSVEIRHQVTRKDFEHWISPDLERVRECVTTLVQQSGTQPERVFLTGGSSLVPAVVELFGSLFGKHKLAGGDEFTSVAKGLALHAAEVGG